MIFPFAIFIFFQTFTEYAKRINCCLNYCRKDIALSVSDTVYDVWFHFYFQKICFVFNLKRISQRFNKITEILKILFQTSHRVHLKQLLKLYLLILHFPTKRCLENCINFPKFFKCAYHTSD